MNSVDMSPAAITRRLKQVDELREACLALAGPRLKRPWGVPPPRSTLELKESPAAYAPSGKEAPKIKP